MVFSILTLSNISKFYGDGAYSALTNVSFSIQSGKTVAVVGASGSGKSTLLNIIGLLDQADRGHLCINGYSVTDISPAEAAQLRNELIGFVFQSFQLLPRLTAWENVALPLFHRGIGVAERKARAIAMLGRVGLADRIGYRPEQLSGGQRQRVAIARALVGEPRLILADEPTGNLDTTTGGQVMELLLSLNRELGVTIVMVTHDRDMAKLCDRVIEIRDGRVLSQGKGM